MISLRKPLIHAIGAAALGLLACWPVSAHHGIDPLEAAAVAPAAGAPEERLAGRVHRLTIDDRVTGSVLELYSLELDDGTAVPIRGPQASGLEVGARIEVLGRRNGKALFVGGMRQLAPAAPAAAGKRADSRVQLAGKLALLHADHFAEARSEFVFEVHDAAGKPTRLDFHVTPEALHPGMQVVVNGVVAADGTGVAPETVTVEALASPVASLQTALATRTNNALVILMTFTDSPAIPFSQAQVQTVFSGTTGSVAQYFSEVSFGQQLLNPTVTAWLATNAATPSGCNWQQMGTLGRNAATAAGYSTANYQNIVYVFPRVSACGWAGLAYIGASGVWINGYNSTSVYGHELGHNFGLLHAGSLRCSGVAIGGTCSVTEYGDPFDIMGNQSAMHFNAAQKLDLGWIATGTVVNHTAGSGTYVLNPIESAGGAVYAVRIPAATNRTYWLEYRQPIGFDAGLASYPNNGAQVRVVSPFETLCSGCDAYSNDTQLVDMTPGTSSFTDAALVVGKSFADSTYGINISVLSATASGLTVQVTAPGGVAASSTTLASSTNPAAAGASVTFTATVTGSAPTGSVRFTADGTTISGCSAVALVTNGNVGTAACGTSSLAAGTHSIVASYAGNAGNASSTSGTLSQVINAPLAVTTTTLASSANPALQGTSVTFTAVVTGSAPTGSVRFTDNGTTIAGCASVALAGSGNTRTTACSTSGLAVGSHSVVASYGGDAANAGSTSAPLSQSVNASFDLAWVDDALPAGAVPGSTIEGWNWVATNPTPYSGARAHQSDLRARTHQHYFGSATATLSIGANDTLYAYVYLDPANPPTEVMLQWHDGVSWEHRAYWGANNIGFGTAGTASRRYMGPLPGKGQWVRLEVPAAQVGLGGATVSGMAFTLYDGRATWDRAGKVTGTSPPAVVWVDDAAPAGALTGGSYEGWSWVAGNPTPYSGTLAHQSALLSGMHQHFFYMATATLSVGANDTLFAYVYLDAANPPTEVMLQWYDGASWEHRAYWGANSIGFGADGTAGRRYLGPLPAKGQWVRLEVPAAQVGLGGTTVSGMAFTLYDGRATWDYAGK